MKKITIILVMALLCLNFCLKAQGQIDQPKPLNVGDELPASFWQQEHALYQNGKISKQNLSTYKGKLLLLDFWATWCGSCIKKFPFLDSLQQKEGAKLNVLLVNTIQTKDNLTKIKARLDHSMRKQVAFSLPTIYNDEYLMLLFPQHLVPHYVWINATGHVVAITGSDFLNTTSINSILNR